MPITRLQALATAKISAPAKRLLRHAALRLRLLNFTPEAVQLCRGAFSSVKVTAPFAYLENLLPFHKSLSSSSPSSRLGSSVASITVPMGSPSEIMECDDLHRKIPLLIFITCVVFQDHAPARFHGFFQYWDNRSIHPLLLWRTGHRHNGIPVVIIATWPVVS